MDKGAVRPQGEIGDRHHLFGIIHAFANRMQTVGDRLFEELTWKQWFTLLGLTLFGEAPGIQELARTVGSSHQNTKQLLLRMQKAGFVSLQRDPADHRRTLVLKTGKAEAFDRGHRADAQRFLGLLYQGIGKEEVAVTLRTLRRMERNLLALDAGAEDGEEEGA